MRLNIYRLPRTFRGSFFYLPERKEKEAEGHASEHLYTVIGRKSLELEEFALSIIA